MCEIREPRHVILRKGERWRIALTGLSVTPIYQGRQVRLMHRCAKVPEKFGACGGQRDRVPACRHKGLLQKVTDEMILTG